LWIATFSMDFFWTIMDIYGKYCKIWKILQHMESYGHYENVWTFMNFYVKNGNL
jgi:hypothetical protein